MLPDLVEYQYEKAEHTHIHKLHVIKYGVVSDLILIRLKSYLNSLFLPLNWSCDSKSFISSSSNWSKYQQ